MDKRERLQKITGNKSFSSARLSTELFNKMAAIILWIAESSWTASKNREGSRKQPSGSTGDLTALWKWVSDCNFPNFPAWLGHETGLERLEWRGGEVWSDYCFSAVQSCRKSRDKRTLRAAPLVCVEARSSQRQRACYCTTSGDHKSAKSLKRGLFKSYKHQNPIAGRVWWMCSKSSGFDMTTLRDKQGEVPVSNVGCWLLDYFPDNTAFQWRRLSQAGVIFRMWTTL